jgi:hypothetical protein
MVATTPRFVMPCNEVEGLRESSPEIDCLLSHLKAQLLSEDSILEEAEAMLLRNRDTCQCGPSALWLIGKSF